MAVTKRPSSSPQFGSLCGGYVAYELRAVDGTQHPPMLHGDRAANMLFNDGSIRLIRLPSQGDAGFLYAASIRQSVPESRPGARWSGSVSKTLVWGPAIGCRQSTSIVSSENSTYLEQ